MASNGRIAPRFVYVEDDEMSRMVMSITLTEVLGYSELHMLGDSVNFMERLNQLAHAPTVIFLDVQIRPHDGFELLRMLRADARYSATTVIAMTANVMSNDVAHLRASGFSGLIGKPIVQDIFPALIEKILAGEPVWYIP